MPMGKGGLRVGDMQGRAVAGVGAESGKRRTSVKQAFSTRHG